MNTLLLAVMFVGTGLAVLLLAFMAGVNAGSYASLGETETSASFKAMALRTGWVGIGLLLAGLAVGLLWMLGVGR